MDIKEHKKSFQLERMILFSDAVFAIAITLLVIDLKLPQLEENNNHALTESLMNMLPHFISFFISFAIIGIYWIAHHRMFYYVIDYDSGLIWLNLLLLFFIVLMPFSSAVYGVHTFLNSAFLLYFINITMLALFNSLIYWHISRKEKKLSHGLENRKLVKYYMLRSWVVPLCFALGLTIALVSHDRWSMIISRMSPLLILPIMRLMRKRFGAVLEQHL